MRIYPAVLSLFLSLFLLAAPVAADDAAAGGATGSHLVVYYFHGDFRCVNCHKIEQYTKEALDEYFKKDMEDGLIVFKTVNVDKKENSHFIDDYQLYTRSVVVSVVKDGKEAAYSNLQGVWEHLRNKQRFLDYIKGEVGKCLKELG